MMIRRERRQRSAVEKFRRIARTPESWIDSATAIVRIGIISALITAALAAI